MAKPTPFPEQPMLARRQIRLAVVSLLQAANTQQNYGWSVESPGSWATPPEKMPQIQIRCGGEEKQSKGRNVPQFDTLVHVVVEARLNAETDVDAQDQIEALGFLIENLIMLNYALMGCVQQVLTVDTETDINTEGKKPIGAIKMTFGFETFETFNPVAPIPAPSQWPIIPATTAPLQEVQLHADLTNRFDPSGTYNNPPFPAAVDPAPRTSGPDGRDEGALDINLPQP